MKAKFIQVGKNFEIRLEDGTVYTSNKNETSKVFTDRVRKAAALDQGDLDITELTIDTFKNLTVEQLQTAKAKESGLLVALLDQAIAARGIEKPATNGGLSAEAQKNVDAINNREANKKAADEAKAKTAADKLAAKEAAAAVKAEAKAKKDAEKAAKKAEKVAAPKQTLKEVMAAAAEAKKNVGHALKFAPHRTAMKTDGVINGVWVDKRVPMALYRIFDADGVMYNKIINAPDLEIGELVPNKKAEEAAAKKAEKEVAATAKKEAAEKAKTEKAEAKIKAAEEKAAAAVKKAEEKAAAAVKKAEEAATIKKQMAEKHAAEAAAKA